MGIAVNVLFGYHNFSKKWDHLIIGLICCDYFKVNILTTYFINKVYLTIKVFNYLYAGLKNVSLEDAETPEAKLLLQYILRYYVYAKISTQSHLIHGVIRFGTKMSSLPKLSTSISKSRTSLALPCLFPAWLMQYLIFLMNTMTVPHQLLLLNATSA